MAAYRRDDWPTGELSALRRHLEGCAECRQVEATFRGVGERIRRLPSIAPPPSMRENVFAAIAAIAAEERQVTPAVIELSRATTDPAMPIVRLTRRPPQRAPLNLGLRAALIAAAVLLTFLVAHVVPSVSTLSRIASSFSQGSGTTPQSQAHRSLSSTQRTYAVPMLLSEAASAMATDTWLAYVSANGTAAATLFIEDRQTQTRTAIATGDAALLPTIRALTDGWVVWSTGSESTGSWALYARALPVASGGANATLVASGENGLVSLTGAWAHGNTALVTGETVDGTGMLLRIDLATGTHTVLASAAGHYYASPSATGSVTYWSDVTFDTLRGLRGTIDQLGTGGSVVAVASDPHRFVPLVAENSLTWISVSDASLTTAATGFTTLSAASGEAMLFQLTGEVEVAGSEIGSGDAVLAPYLAAGGNLIIWRTAGGWHAYDLGGKASVDGLAGANEVAITETAIVWTEGADTTTLYVAPTN